MKVIPPPDAKMHPFRSSGVETGRLEDDRAAENVHVERDRLEVLTT